MNPAWPQPTEQDQLRFLFQLGYFDAGWEEVKEFLFTSSVVKDAIENYADFHGLSGQEPSEHMLRPRCGLPDFVRDPQEAGQSRWRMPDVTTSHRLSGLNPLSAEREHALWLASDEAWNAVCGIRLKYIEDMNSANIYANPGSTGAGVLAYSYMPDSGYGPEQQLEQVYNRATNWSERLFLQVLIHEKGHAIGLDHGPSGSLMQPTAGGDITSPQSWDIEQAVSRYGKPGPKPPPIPSGFPLTLKSRLTPGGYQLEKSETDYDFEVATAIHPGRYRAVNEFDMGG